MTRRIALKPLAGHEIKVKPVSLPDELQVSIHDRSAQPEAIGVKVAFSSARLGLHQGKVALVASDERGNRQTIELEYCAFVLSPDT